MVSQLVCLVQVKIGDFGFTKRLACNTASLKVKRITHPRWVAPEVSSEGIPSALAAQGGLWVDCICRLRLQLLTGCALLLPNNMQLPCCHSQQCL